MKNRIAVRLGRLGGLARSEAKTRAVRENARKGGRKRKYPPCPRYTYHKFVNINKQTGFKYCPCGYIPELTGESQSS